MQYPIETARQYSGDGLVAKISPVIFLPLLGAIGYPFLLMLFHTLIGAPGSRPNGLSIVAAVLALVCAGSVPALGIWVACKNLTTSLRRLAYATVIAPTLYVFLGVVQALAGSPIPDPWAWCAIWLAVTGWALVSMRHDDRVGAPAIPPRWRVAHGISAAILCLYVLFHIANHLGGLRGPAMHAAIMEMGRTVYRAGAIEPLLVALMLFQVASGSFLAWRWSATKNGFHRTFQIASGAYLSIFVLGHMNSVFIYARAFLGIPTDWKFATGAPAGLIHDPWNIRLVPHYALGVFFVLSHLMSGLRVVLMAHGTEERFADGLWLAGVALSGAIAIAILAGMCGVRV